MRQDIDALERATVSQSIRKVRSLTRGLDVLRLLNVANASTLTQLVKTTALPRGTVYRLLETLIGLGFVKRLEPDGTYVLTARVMALSNGFDAENWPAEVAKPKMIQLGEQLGWPVVLATLYGTSMVIRENTDRLTSMVFNVIRPGYSMPVLASASGWIYLAYCEPKERSALLATIDDDADNPWRELTMGSVNVDYILAGIRKDGYCILPQPTPHTTVVSVPIFQDQADGARRFLAALSVRYFTSSMSTTQARERFVDPMTACASCIQQDHRNWTRTHAR